MNPSQPGMSRALLAAIALAVVVGAVALGFALGRSGPADRPAATVAAPPPLHHVDGQWVDGPKLASIREERAKDKARALKWLEKIRAEEAAKEARP